MAWQKGQSGNPNGRPTSDKCFTDLLRIAVSETDEASGKQNLRVIADQLTQAAKAGESWAIQQVADRLDGKPHQTSAVSVGQNVASLSDSELTARIQQLAARFGCRIVRIDGDEQEGARTVPAAAAH